MVQPRASADAAEGSVLVTGGGGFLGSHVVDAFVAEGRRSIIAIGRSPNKYPNSSARYLTCDVTCTADLAAAIDQVRPTVIVHTVTPGPFAPAAAHRADYAATRKLVELAAKAPSVKALVYSGSAEAVANFSGARSTPLSEDEAILHTPRTTSSTYARNKAASQAFVLAANGPNLRTAVLCLPGMYGPRDRNIAFNLLNMTNTLAPRIQLGDNKVVHDWLFVETAAQAHVLAADALLAPQRDAAHKIDGEAFFVSDGTPMRFWDFARKMWAAAGDKHSVRGARVISIPWAVVLALAVVSEAVFLVCTLGRKVPGLTRMHVHYMKEGAWFDVDKARQRLGWEPRVSTDEGIRRTVAWFQGRRVGAGKIA